jgi:hypothetical protein
MQSSGKPGILRKDKKILNKNQIRVMNFVEFEKLISPQRLGRYYNTCNFHALKTLTLYRANIHISQAFLGVLSVFEIVLRNRIDLHYRAQLSGETGKPTWLLASSLPGGFLTARGCESSLKKVMQAYEILGSNYTHDKLIAELSFGFWRHLFAGRQFKAGGGTLLAIFPRIPPRCNQTFIYQKLHRINSIRNRIAHHEPICFGCSNTISTLYARSHFQEMIDILDYMAIDSRQLLQGFNNVLQQANYIDSI